MTEDSKRIPSAPCPGDPHNCELLLSSQEAYHGHCAQAEISGHEAVVSAMAVGLVIDVSAERAGRRRGPRRPGVIDGGAAHGSYRDLGCCQLC